MRRNTLMQKVAAYGLSAAMVLSLCPTTVFASEVSSEDEIAVVEESEEDTDTQTDADSGDDTSSESTDTGDDTTSGGTASDDETTQDSADDSAAGDSSEDVADEEDSDSTEDAETGDDTVTDETDEDAVYVMMNIPYDEFYAAELNNDVDVDVVTSATGNKWKNMFTSTTYSAATETGGQILGVTFPVKTTEDVLTALEAEELAEDAEIYEAGDYTYSVSEEAYTYYKELTLDADGNASFSAASYEADAVELTDAETTFATSSNYGDYQLNVTSSTLSGDVYAVIVTASDGTSYGLRALENIWKSGSQLSWSCGVKTTESHGNTLSYDHYASMMGKTISQVTYYTSDGIYTVSDLSYYVGAKSTVSSVSVEDAEASTGTTSFTVTLPEDFAASYSVDIEGAAVEVDEDGNGTITFDTATADGSYTLTISDTEGYYADVTASFTVYTTVYALMNIPYADFYANELTNDVEVDTVTSATSSKWSRQSATYYEAITDDDGNTTGGTILGVSFPVVTTAAQLTTLGAAAVESEDDLAGAGDYAYYAVEADTYSYSKTLTVTSNKRGTTITFSAASYEADAVELTDATYEFTTESNYGDYQLNVSSDTLSGTVYGVIITTSDGTGYGLRHLENIWRSGSQLSWAVNEGVTERHGNTLSYEHYASIVGKTISQVTYYTSDGIYYVTLSQKVYAVSGAEVSAEDVAVGSDSITITISDLEEDFSPVFAIDDEDVEATKNEDGTWTLTYNADTVGTLTITISDENGEYADLSTSITVTTETVYAQYDAESLSLIAADAVETEEFETYLAAITAVSVDGTSYSTSGRDSAEIIDTETGEILVDATVSSGMGPDAESTALFAKGSTYTLIVSATGYLDLEFEITIPYLDLSDAEIELSETTYTYDGSAKTPDVTVTLDDAVLTEGTDYEVSYSNNTGAGTATVIVTGTGDYTGSSLTETFEIEAQALTSSNVSLSYTSKTYTGSALKPTVTVKNAADTTLTSGTDYSVSYSSNTNKGTATVTVTGKGNYTGTVTKTFTITAQELSSSNVSLSYTSKTYTGSALKPTVTVKNAAGTTLTSGTDYTVTYSDNTDVGTAIVTIKGKGNYSGTVKVTFTITAQKLKSSKISLSYTSKTYTGSKLKPTVTVKNSAGTKLTKGTDYTVSYSSNKNVGTATVTIKGKGNYSGTVTKTFKITKASQTLKVTKSTKSVKYSKVKKAKQTVKAITKVSGAKGTVTYSKVSGSSKLTVNKTTGKITVKKGTKKGTYKIKVKVTSAATGNYKKATKTVTITVKVK